MLNQILFYTSAIFVVFWGIAHLVPTKNVVAGFGDISDDNKYIITMEWVIEGVALIFIGSLVGMVTFIDSTNTVSHAVYWLSAGTLQVLAVISLLTGSKVDFFIYKLCPVIFFGASFLILLGIVS